MKFIPPPPPHIKTNKLLQDQLDFLRAAEEGNRLSASRAMRIATLANIIAIIAIAIATKDQIFDAISWLIGKP